MSVQKRDNRIYWALLVALLGIMLPMVSLAQSSVVPLPDNVDSATCTVAPEASLWSISEPIVSNFEVTTASTPIIGDIDDDGL